MQRDHFDCQSSGVLYGYIPKSQQDLPSHDHMNLTPPISQKVKPRPVQQASSMGAQHLTITIWGRSLMMCMAKVGEFS
jgi:hypothetical protein